MTVDPGSRGWMEHRHLPVAGAGTSGITTVRDEGTGLSSRPALNFTGAGVTATDNPTTGATDVTIPGGGGTPSGSVVSETAFGQAAAAGTSTNYSRGDHTHGTPAAPVSGAATFLSVSKWGLDQLVVDTPRRIGPTALTTSAVTQLTVPTATTTILRNIHVANTTAVAIAVRVSIGADAAATRLYSDTLVPANGVLDWSGFLPMSATEVLQALGGAAGLTLTAGAVDVT